VKREPLSVVANEAVGPYTLLRVERGGLEPGIPGQFFMLTPPGRLLPRPMSLCLAPPRELGFLIDPIGPGTRALCAAQPGEEIFVVGPLGNGFVRVDKPLLVGGGIGIAPLALLRRAFAAKNVPTRVLLGFRDKAHSGGLDDLFSCCEVRLASDDGHAGHHGYVTDLLATMLAGDDAASAVVYSCGPPAMLEAVRTLCAEHGVACELAMESPMACGFGACHGCAVRRPGGDGYLRLCVDGPVLRGG
jgi:NAD(P)H-flavin reductase